MIGKIDPMPIFALDGTTRVVVDSSGGCMWRGSWECTVSRETLRRRLVTLASDLGIAVEELRGIARSHDACDASEFAGTLALGIAEETMFLLGEK